MGPNFIAKLWSISLTLFQDNYIFACISAGTYYNNEASFVFFKWLFAKSEQINQLCMWYIYKINIWNEKKKRKKNLPKENTLVDQVLIFFYTLRCVFKCLYKLYVCLEFVYISECETCVSLFAEHINEIFFHRIIANFRNESEQNSFYGASARHDYTHI